MLSLRAMLSLGLGEAAGQLTDVVRADQFTHGGVVRWRHGPVIAGCAAAPDPPPRVLAPEPRKFGIPVVLARPGVHGGQRQVAARPRCCGRRARAWMPAGAMQLPPPGRIRGAGQTKRHKRQPARLPGSRPLPGRVRVTRPRHSPALMHLRRCPPGDGAPPEIRPGSGSSCPPPVSRAGTRHLIMQTARPAHRVTRRSS